jgi:Tfp pilus assembly protein PilO
MNIKNLDRLCLGLLILVVCSCGFWAVTDISKKKKYLRQENELLTHRLKDLNLADTNLQRLKKGLDDAQNELRTLNEKIPETANIGVLLKKVDGIMKFRNITMINIEPLATIERKLYTRIPIRIIFKGAFADVYETVLDLETMNRILVMEKINISKTVNQQLCKVDLTACVFERSEPMVEKLRKLI